MYKRCLADGIAFWTAVYDADRQSLLDTIRRHRLPQIDPLWIEAPHLSRNRLDIRCRLWSLRGDIISLVGSRPIPKNVRRMIYEIPKIPFE